MNSQKVGSDAKNKAIHAKSGGKSSMYVSPTGSKHRIGSQKHRYWESIVKRGEDNRKAGVPND